MYATKCGCWLLRPLLSAPPQSLWLTHCSAAVLEVVLAAVQRGRWHWATLGHGRGARARRVTYSLLDRPTPSKVAALAALLSEMRLQTIVLNGQRPAPPLAAAVRAEAAHGSAFLLPGMLRARPLGLWSADWA